MARPKSHKPAYCLHRSSGRAFVRLDGVTPIYLGKHGTQESRDKYDRLIGEWIAQGRTTSPRPAGGSDGRAPAGLSIAQLVHAFWNHCKGYYRDRDGKIGGEAENFRGVLRRLRRMYGDTPAADFGPVKLKALREDLIKPQPVKVSRRVIDPATGKPQRDPETGKLRKIEVEIKRHGWCRNYINRQISRVRQCFKWGVENELLPPAVYQGLQAVAGLKKGKSDARETKAVKPAPDADVLKVLPLLSPQVRAMVELEAITGMRPGEVRIMRTGDIDRSDPKLWVYRPAHHKTAHHGDDHVREIFLGSKAQEIVRAFLKLNPTAYLFSPAEAEEWRREQQREKRKTPLTPSQIRRAQAAAKRARRHADHYDKNAFNRAIRRACTKAGLGQRWTPNRLRHAAATRIRELYGLEAAQVILGHKTLRVTQIYAEKNVAKARQIMGEVG